MPKVVPTTMAAVETWMVNAVAMTVIAGPNAAPKAVPTVVTAPWIAPTEAATKAAERGLLEALSPLPHDFGSEKLQDASRRV